MKKIEVRANPKCMYCLGSGIAAVLFTPQHRVCSCVTEQLKIVTFPKDHSIPASDRYQPGEPDFEAFS